MAVSRHGNKKSKKGGKKAKKKSARKSRARVAQGKKLARNNKRYHALLNQGYSKAQAKAEAFGHRTGGKRAKAKKGGKGKSHRGLGAESRSRLYDAALKTVQMWNGTSGFPPSAAELYQAEQLVKEGESYRHSVSRASSTERLREKAIKDIERAAKDAAVQIVRLKREQKERERAAAEKAAEEAEIKKTAASFV